MGIYGIHCKPADRWYVGASVNIHKRFYEHWNNTQLGMRWGGYSHMAEDARAYGLESFQAYIIELVDDRAHLAERECFWQTKLKSVTEGYNQQASGRHRDW
jgi:group I intron endonuclease